jgi:hypothetical protein
MILANLTGNENLDQRKETTMFKHDVIQIVDLYPRHGGDHEPTAKVDADEEAKSLSTLVLPLGRDARKIVIVGKNDERRLLAFQRAGYETHSMNGNRPTELRQFIRQMTAQIKQTEPKHTVLVSDDPEFVFFCEAVAPHTNLNVWANSATVPHELMEPNYNFRALEELLPDLKILRIDVRVDLENIFIGLVKRGWKPNMPEMIDAIRAALADLGEIVTITGYADWDELNRHHGGPSVNWQRELALAKGESRYVVNQHGKNTADMKIADDIRTLLEHEPTKGPGIDVLALATMDRDFRTVVETTLRRGKRVVILGLEGGFSRDLQGLGAELRCLDKHLRLAQPDGADLQQAASASIQDVAYAMRIAAWLRANRWKFVYRDRLEQQFSDHEGLRKLIADNWLSATHNSAVDAEGQPRMLQVNPNHTTASAAGYLAQWIPDRIDYCLRQRGMPHVDTNFLAQGMTRDNVLNKMGIGQNRVAAENWLNAAAAAGLVVAVQQEHPLNASKLITTWRLPAQSPPTQEPAQDPVQEPEQSEPPPASAGAPTGPTTTSAHLRQGLTEGLSDSELTRLTYDYFRPVYQEVEGAPKFARIQALLDYVDRTDQSEQLVTAIRTINPALSLAPESLPLAA